MNKDINSNDALGIPLDNCTKLILHIIKNKIFELLRSNQQAALNILIFLIKLIPEDAIIPAGRPYATIARREGLTMKQKMLDLPGLYEDGPSYGDGPPSNDTIMHVTMCVYDYFVQSEQDLIETNVCRIQLLTQLQELHGTEIEVIEIIKRALRRIDNEGSPNIQPKTNSYLQDFR